MAAVGFSFPTIDARSNPILQICENSGSDEKFPKLSLSFLDLWFPVPYLSIVKSILYLFIDGQNQSAVDNA